MADDNQEVSTPSPRPQGGRPDGPRPDRGPGGREGGGRKFFRRKKVCKFCVEKIDDINYKDVRLLGQFVAERGKIVPRRLTGVCTPHQRRLTPRSRHRLPPNRSRLNKPPGPPPLRNASPFVMSRSAIKAMQIKYGLPADSWPTAELLARMRGGTAQAQPAAVVR